MFSLESRVLSVVTTLFLSENIFISVIYTERKSQMSLFKKGDAWRQVLVHDWRGMLPRMLTATTGPGTEPRRPCPTARERLTPDVGSAEVRISTLEENESFSNFPKALHGLAKELWAWHSCLYE